MLSLLNAVNAHPHCMLIYRQWGTAYDNTRYIDFPLTFNTCFFGTIRAGSRFIQELGSWPDVKNYMSYRATEAPSNSFSINIENAEKQIKVSYFLVGK